VNPLAAETDIQQDSDFPWQSRGLSALAARRYELLTIPSLPAAAAHYTPFDATKISDREVQPAPAHPAG